MKDAPRHAVAEEEVMDVEITEEMREESKRRQAEYDAEIKAQFSNNTVTLDDYRPHIVREVICVKCGGGRAIACYPQGTLLKDLECGGCHQIGGVIATGEYHDQPNNR